MNKKDPMPIIKESKISTLINALSCFDKYPYDREKQRDCVLELYPNKSEKSVFRGMIIPSLRYLGFIVGYEDLIRPSANGKIILEARKKSVEEALKVTRVMMLELDKEKFGFIQKLKHMKNSRGTTNKKEFINLMSKEIEGPSQKQKEERIMRWSKILQDCGLIKFIKKEYVMLQKENLEQADEELKTTPKRPLFKNILFDEYKSLPYSETAGIIDIVLLRELVGIRFYKEYGMILTEFQFDELLSKLDFVANDYLISLGHPMGAEEKLFHYKGECYRTLSIKFLRGGGKNV